MNRRDRRAGRPHEQVLASPVGGRLPMPSAAHLFDLACEHHHAGRLPEAEAAYRQILEVDPRHADSLNSLGILAHQYGHSDDAIALIGKAIAVNNRIAQYHHNIGLVFAALGRMEDAVTHSRRAVALKPDYADAHTNLAGALTVQGHMSEAVLHFRRALARRGNEPLAYCNLATALRAEGKPADALSVTVRGLGVKETDELKNIFVLCLQEQCTMPKLPGLSALAERALAECWGRPSDLAPACAVLVKQSDTIAACIGRTWHQRPNARDVFGAKDLEALASDRLFRQLIMSTPICDVTLERLLTTSRSVLLDLATTPAAADVSDSVLWFCCALAQQCFINEYVFDRGAEEHIRALGLAERLRAALEAAQSIPALMVAAVAAYIPLHSLGVTLEPFERAWPPAVQRLVAQQVHEPAHDHALRSSIPALTPIADGVSALVRQQYEENPYPRWTGIASLDQRHTFDEQLSIQYPHAKFAKLGKSDFDCLIAGCGTGRHAIETARQHAGARVLAIDLSLTSLAYAARKACELGVPNIEFAQADILQLGSLGRTFDVIESVGVLHHLRDPLEGWRTLLALLQPGGFMRIGLYSALARANVTAARTFAASRGHSGSAESIRQCRQDILASDDELLRTISHPQDFFTISGCRDLMFHVQEHYTDIPAIGAFLAANHLAFIGFDTPARRLYAKACPDDVAMTDLGRWHDYETANPATFAGMYQFWVQKTVS